MTDIFPPINDCPDGFCPLPTKKSEDIVNSPSHYMRGGMEAIDVMSAFSSKEEFVGHLRLCAIKYLMRLNQKDTPEVNARKSLWYVKKLCEELSE